MMVFATGTNNNGWENVITGIKTMSRENKAKKTNKVYTKKIPNS